MCVCVRACIWKLMLDADATCIFVSNHRNAVDVLVFILTLMFIHFVYFTQS